MESNFKNYCSVGVIMNKNNKFQVRLYQSWQKVSGLFAFLKEPPKYIGSGTISQINHVILDKKHQIHNVLIVTGPHLYKTSLLNTIFENLKRNGINFSVFSGAKINPTIEQIEEGVLLYKEKRCECIVAVGGGSVIDTAKCIGARAANPKTPLKDMFGIMKVKNNLPLFIAIPTTPGCGSEASFTAFISEGNVNYKYSIIDRKLLPNFVILDPELTIGLNKEQLAYSAVDALTHAIEAYISKGHTMGSDRYAIDAAKLICDNIELAYSNTEKDKNALKIHENLLLGAHYAGLACSKACVGFCHAISYAIGSTYDIPHGLLNAIVLPYVLRAYGESTVLRLADLADEIAYRISVDSYKKADWLINRVDSINSYLGIKNNLEKIIKPKDIHKIAIKAFEIATPSYPAPKMFSVAEIEAILNDICK